MKFPNPQKGDKVAIPYGGFGRGGIAGYGEDVIERWTPTQVILAGQPEARWKRANGSRVGAGAGYIEPWTPEHDAFVAAAAVANRLEKLASELDKHMRKTSVRDMQADPGRSAALADAIEKYLAPTEPTP